jgi:hypothetical protein
MDMSNTMDSLPHEDRVLFGTKTFTISDRLSDIIDAALVEGVASLPRLSDEEALLKMLRKAYVRNIHVLEAYMGRNIFSVQSLPPSRRRKIVEAFVTNNLPETPDTTENKENVVSSTFVYPTADQIPSHDELTATEEELKNLRDKLTEVKRRRKQLAATMEKLALARQVIPSVPKVQVRETVTHLVKAKETLEDLTFKAKELMAKLDDEKRSRHDEDDAPAIPKKPKLGLEEAYEQESQNITLEGLQKIKQFLHQ